MESASMADVETSNKLIQLVKDQPSLYDKDLEDFKDEYKKSETWRVIAETLNLDVDETQKQWARLRVEFGRHRRRRKAAEAAGGFIRDWPLYSQLGWLAPHVKTRAKRGKSQNDRTYTYAPRTILPRRSDWLMGTNTERGVSVEVSPSIVMQNGHSDMTESFVVSPDAADYDEEGSLDNGLHGSIKREMDLGKDHEDMHAADSRSCQPTGYEEEDEDNLFCRSICASLKRFSHQQKALAKIRIQQVMYDVEFDEVKP